MNMVLIISYESKHTQDEDLSRIQNPRSSYHSSLSHVSIISILLLLNNNIFLILIH